MVTRALGSLCALALLGCADPADTPAAQNATTSGSSDAGAGCGAGSLLDADGVCAAAGIPADECAPGFTADGASGCAPILPAEPCAPGQLALLGETSCHDVAPCGAAPWGDIDVSGPTEYVDGSYDGGLGPSDGGASRPWTTIQDAIDAAADGAVIAIAEGTYAEDLDVKSKPVRIWGRCPGLVHVVGQGGLTGTVYVTGGAGGSEIRAISVSGPSNGIFVSGSTGIVAEAVWVHDTGKDGIQVHNGHGATSFTLSGSLVERVRRRGFLGGGVVATIERTVVRDPIDIPVDGDAVVVSPGPNDLAQSEVTVRASVIERNRRVGIMALGSKLVVEGTLVRETAATGDGQFGRGLEIESDPVAGPASASVRGTVIEAAHEFAVYVSGSQATIESTVVRATEPRVLDGARGRGLHVQMNSDQALRSDVTVRNALLERHRDIGVLATSSDLLLERVIVRDVEVQTSDGAFGDAVAVVTSSMPANAVLRGCLIQRGARAGVAAFGASVSIGATKLDCNTFALDGEAFEQSAYAFEDALGNSCGCNGDEGPCSAVTSSLEPPAP